ncbi:MAG: DMT family transporter [Proteobacteria bacterium]|nr:DMT family transporter [Pseudomonadota bacterium]
MSGPGAWIALLIVMNLFWAGSYSVMKYGLGSMDPLSLVFWRLVAAFAILALWIAARRHDLRIGWRDGARVALAGLLIAFSSYSTVKGVELSNAIDASLLYVFEPVWAIALACIVLRERMLFTTLAGLAIALAGLARLSGFDPKSLGFAGGGVGVGNLLIVAGLLTEAFFSIILKPASARRPAAVLFAGVLFTAACALAVPMQMRQGFAVPLDGRSLFAIGYLAVICTALGYTAWVAVLGRVPLSVMEFTIFIQPVAGALIANAALGEPIDARVGAGGALCVLGMIVAVTGHIRHAGGRASRLAEEALAAPADAL